MSDRAIAQPAKPAGRKFWVGLAISAITLVLALRGVRWTELLAALQAVDLRILLLAVVAFVLNLAARGLRWQTLLQPLSPVSWQEAFAFLNIGYMANDLLPLRAGEVIRAVLLASKKQCSTAAVLGTVVVERLLDMLTLAGLALLLMQLMPLPALVKQSALIAAGVAAAAWGALWWAAPRLASPSPRVPGERSTPLRLPASLAGINLRPVGDLLHRLTRAFATGLAALRSPRQGGLAAGYSLLAWALVLASTWLVLRACQLHLPWTAALMVVVVVNLGLALPSSPGFVGVMHFLAVMALTPWSVAPSAALTFAIIYHGVSFLVTLVLGLLYLWREGLKLAHIRIVIDS